MIIIWKSRRVRLALSFIEEFHRDSVHLLFVIKNFYGLKLRLPFFKFWEWLTGINQ